MDRLERMLTRKYTWDEVKCSSKMKDGIIALYLYRKFAYVLTYFLVNVGNVSANQVTLLAFASWASSAILIWFDQNIVASILIFLGFVLDCTDGNIARLKNQVSKKGKLLDTISDRISYLSILLVLAVKISFIYPAPHLIALAGLLIVLLIIIDVVRRHVEKIVASDIHDTHVINNFESKIKAKLKKIIPFINWENIIIGIGADLEWTLLIITVIFPLIFIFILYILILLIGLGIFLITVSLIGYLNSKKGRGTI
ncbi:MAG: CDP-alcohol phosphatidyltransferase family protein [Candidatus Odinarchaeum yellowstonii]|uniref:CDP-alcohol phosphatidyltransferase family protein n=1 Tax=Odinarchaeota yellowstonii (strain LCB_4) TaxID=1841599 RepID=A0AAF0D2M7_ODILC|nr:MAG: CDP-alcohol phosphatidyltransferase family protein [Candidatus Odinarchaeum yellowstonii]